MILVLEYEGETAESKAGILNDADNLKNKIDRKYGVTTKIVKTRDELARYFADPDSKTESKLHIMAHGNTRQVGNYNAAALGRFLNECGFDKRKNIEQITIHSCFSSYESVNPENNSWSPSLAWQLASFFSQTRRGLVVRGSVGESFTDSTGKNWALREGEVMEKTNNREREIGFIERKTVDRATARPKWAVEWDGSVAKR